MDGGIEAEGGAEAKPRISSQSRLCCSVKYREAIHQVMDGGGAGRRRRWGDEKMKKERKRRKRE